MLRKILDYLIVIFVPTHWTTVGKYDRTVANTLYGFHELYGVTL
jgi:hypothetical protein